MRLERISPHVWSLRIWLGISIHVWLVLDDGGVTLVDAGVRPMAGGILRQIELLRAGPLQRIALTHGHADHVGALPKILASRPVPVLVHRTEIPYMEGALPYPRRGKPVAFVTPGLVRPLPEDGFGQLQRVGGLTPYLTPGHSPGHAVYHHEEDDVLLAGDLVTARRGRLRPPMAIFTGDMRRALASVEIIGKLRPRRLEACHGGTVLEPAEQLPLI